MTHTTQTLIAISTATRKADGWYDRTASALARFNTEALRDAAIAGVAGLSTSERSKFAATVSSFELDGISTMRRERAIELLCSWCHAMRMREWSASFERSLAAARAEFPAAIESLGAAL